MQPWGSQARLHNILGFLPPFLKGQAVPFGLGGRCIPPRGRQLRLVLREQAIRCPLRFPYLREKAVCSPIFRRPWPNIAPGGLAHVSLLCIRSWPAFPGTEHPESKVPPGVQFYGKYSPWRGRCNVVGDWFLGSRRPFGKGVGGRANSCFFISFMCCPPRYSKSSRENPGR